MWIGIVVVLWPYGWKVTGLNLDKQKLTFIFAKVSLEWMWKGRESQEGLKTHIVIIIE